MPQRELGQMVSIADKIFVFVFNLLEQYLIENQVLVEVVFNEKSSNIEVFLKPIIHQKKEGTGCY